MLFRLNKIACLTLLSVLVAPMSLLDAQTVTHSPPATHRALAHNVIVPQWRSFRPNSPQQVQQVAITGVNVGVVVVEQVATTTIDIHLKNSSRQRLEAELMMPVPDGAVVRGFTFQGAGKEPTAQLLPKDQARQIYDDIVRRTKDPALLEFVGYNLVRSSVFPVEPNGTQTLRLTYETLLEADGPRVDYVLPRSEKVDYNVPWNVAIRIQSKKPISTVYSPSHKIETKRSSAKVITARIASDAVRDPGPFRLSYLVEGEGVTASMFGYPDPKNGGGYFLLLAGLPTKPADHDRKNGIKREVTLVLDRSGSMNGEKLEQVREAALQVIAGLDDGEAFNIIVYNEAVEAFAQQPVIKNKETTEAARAYLKALKARGGTNIHDALLESLRQKPRKDMLPIVLFLTDGLPTVGQTSEKAIRETALKANRFERRIFTFGVGADVNTPLLERVAFETRAVSTFVMAKEDVEVKVSQVFKRLAGPVLASPVVTTMNGKDGSPALGRIMDVLPTRLPDLFEGDQLVLLGRYVGDKPVTFRIAGNFLGKKKAFTFTFKPDKSTTRNSYVPRLWASRKIADLIDEIRNMGADSGQAAYGPRPGAPNPNNPKVKELIDEIVRLSTEFGVLTEYTAFLAREGTDLSKKDLVLREAHQNFISRAWQVRSGVASVNQDLNNTNLKQQMYLNGGNKYLDTSLNTVSYQSVQQINDKAFYRRNGSWVDAELIENEKAKPTRVIEFGSKEFNELVGRLTTEGRNGCIALQGDILLMVDKQPVLIKAAPATVATQPANSDPKNDANASQEAKQ